MENPSSRWVVGPVTFPPRFQIQIKIPYRFKKIPLKGTLNISLDVSILKVSLNSSLPITNTTWALKSNYAQVEVKVMEILGGGEALPEDILRILR